MLRSNFLAREIFPGNVNEILCHSYCHLVVLLVVGSTYTFLATYIYIYGVQVRRGDGSSPGDLFHLNFEDHSSPGTKRWRKLTSMPLSDRRSSATTTGSQVDSSVRDQPRCRRGRKCTCIRNVRRVRLRLGLIFFRVSLRRHLRLCMLI